MDNITWSNQNEEVIFEDWKRNNCQVGKNGTDSGFFLADVNSTTDIKSYSLKQIRDRSVFLLGLRTLYRLKLQICFVGVCKHKCSKLIEFAMLQSEVCKTEKEIDYTGNWKI